MRTTRIGAKILTLFTAAMVGASALTFAADTPTTSPSAAPTTQPEENGPTKFYGQITAVDAQAKTFSIGDQTFCIVGETHMTKAADDSAATFADITVGEAARGTYTRTSDGKLNVTKVRFGKKTGGKAGGGGKSGGGKKSATTQPQEQ